ncbi:rRNA 2'-O-methyltransferase fibrillarin-like [Chenopodium quinoa]|uniref:rRNA 2'-O-methyltransferase fibrillarin-like n=1 Tax=Chenopodium quinoa TaxID=63459 RepID=UPI000B785A08|nr:rRNA 2'-O-methyltransferase fibrillarin-like [Chenopodium quinoa]
MGRGSRGGRGKGDGARRGVVAGGRGATAAGRGVDAGSGAAAGRGSAGRGVSSTAGSSSGGASGNRGAASGTRGRARGGSRGRGRNQIPQGVGMYIAPDGSAHTNQRRTRSAMDWFQCSQTSQTSTLQQGPTQ